MPYASLGFEVAKKPLSWLITQHGSGLLQSVIIGDDTSIAWPLLHVIGEKSAILFSTFQNRYSQVLRSWHRIHKATLALDLPLFQAADQSIISASVSRSFERSTSLLAISTEPNRYIAKISQHLTLTFSKNLQ